jgi:hypothetical protein
MPSTLNKLQGLECADGSPYCVSVKYLTKHTAIPESAAEPYWA